jgi:hypothetical protein
MQSMSGETLEVAAGAKLKLRMNDGPIIAIASEGRLTIADYRVGNGGESRDATLSLGAGLLCAVVSTLKGPPHFELDTATGVAAVRSTDWFIEAKPGSTQVGVLEGRVSLRSVATGKEAVIPAHWGARVEAGRDPVPARVWTGPNSTISFGARIWATRRRDTATRSTVGRAGADKRAVVMLMFTALPDNPLIRGIETASLGRRFRLRGVRGQK